MLKGNMIWYASHTLNSKPDTQPILVFLVFLVLDKAESLSMWNGEERKKKRNGMTFDDLFPIREGVHPFFLASLATLQTESYVRRSVTGKLIYITIS